VGSDGGVVENEEYDRVVGHGFAPKYFEHSEHVGG